MPKETKGFGERKRVPPPSLIFTEGYNNRDPYLSSKPHRADDDMVYHPEIVDNISTDFEMENKHKPRGGKFRDRPL